ncbi:hypothetical protein MMC25_007950 [Agyrium rufum]|nr:hypothetical protein [Agyrium rufum]
MGCCSSRPDDDGQTSPYIDSHPHAVDSSSRAAITTSVPPLESSSRHASSQNPPQIPQSTSHQRPQPHPTTGVAPQRRISSLAENFNAPLTPHVWRSKRRTWTRREIDREREEFFDTRVTGRPEIWGALRIVVGLVAEGEIDTAQGILDASGVTVPTGDLINGVYDEHGNLYHLPEVVASYPDNMVEEEKSTVVGEEDGDGEDDDDDPDDDGLPGEQISEEEKERRREEKGKTVLKSGEGIKVRARLSDRGGPDVVVEVAKEQTVRFLIRRIQSEVGIPGKGKIRLAYLGKILKENESLSAQGWREGHVVNALVF